MTNDEKLMQQAMDALQECVGIIGDPIDVIEELRARLAQPKQKNDGYCQACEGDYCTAKSGCVALSNPPSKREWQGLTDEDIPELVREAARGSAIKRDGTTSYRIARAIEAKLKEKNT